MTKTYFTSGAQNFIDKLDARGVVYETRFETDYCQECGGAGQECWCDSGIVEYLVVEYEEQSND